MRESNTKKRIVIFFFKYAHSTFSYFQGQTSKLLFKFCFACYSFPFTSWAPVNMGISFVNEVDTFEDCSENLLNIKDIMGKRNRKEIQRKTEKSKNRASVCNTSLRHSPRLSPFSAQGTSKA